jgi:hypothetical protein
MPVAAAAVPALRKSRRVVMTRFSLFADPDCPTEPCCVFVWNSAVAGGWSDPGAAYDIHQAGSKTAGGALPVTRLLLAGLRRCDVA